MYESGVRLPELVKTYATPCVNRQFIAHSLWSPRREEPRIPSDFPSFKEFAGKHAYGEDGFIIDEVSEVIKGRYNGLVFDFTVDHPNHNFIADNFVVSNCGVRLLKSALKAEEAIGRMPELAKEIYAEVPSGVGRSGRVKMSAGEFDEILSSGAAKAVALGYGSEQDLKQTESEGHLSAADPALVSAQAKSRGRDQLGTMGAGNHFVEAEAVEEIFDEAEAKRLGLFKGQVAVLIHTGSRGLGHQIATDYIRLMMKVMAKYGISLPDRELACAPFNSPEGQDYFKAMSAGANFAWANRQIMSWEVRNAWQKVFGKSGGELELVYDVAHNIAKLENNLIVHRKGATRAFPGQTVIIPGSMGTGSYVLVGEEKSLEESFGSTCHGAGRRMSRTQAKREVSGRELKSELERMGIAVASGSFSGLAEEAPGAYKDIDQVVEVVARAGIAKRVARLKPLAVIKG
ncbi:MAG: RtcB family protein [Patescibacteria group bacterium]|nr:RtcB family protein [Patescibacteria group bacterium]